MKFLLPPIAMQTIIRQIGFRDAMYLIRAYSIAERLPLANHPEFTAIITHWLQTIDSAPIYGEIQLGAKWRRILLAHSWAAIDRNWAGEHLSRRKRIAQIKIDYSDVPFRPRTAYGFRFAELFAGIGGFRLALQKTGGKCVFSSEVDNSARQTYFKNYGEYPFGDIRQFTNETVSDDHIDSTIPDHEIMAAGFPCQPFSKAGVSARRYLGQNVGFDCENQGTLFFDIMRIASVKRPAAILLENVKNILNHDNRQTFQLMKSTVEGLGYSFLHKLIDSSSVVPQRRERCYMVCFRKRKTVFSFPRLGSDALPLSSILEKSPDSLFTISNKLWTGHKKRSKRNRKRKSGFVAITADIRKPANTLIARYGKDGKECLIPQSDQNPRLLTPRECARLQGFPEEFLLPKHRSTAYRQFGNSIAVPVVERIARKMILSLKHQTHRR